LRGPRGISSRGRAIRSSGSQFVEFRNAAFAISRSKKRSTMRFAAFLGIAILLAIFWVVGFLMFHIASALIHLLLVVAVIFFIISLFSRSKAA
jgi:fatty acid desaturase